MKNSKLLALLGAAVLSLGVFGIALAATPASDRGVTPTFHDGNITLTGEGNNDSPDCDVADGIETGDEGGSDSSENGVTVTWTYDSDTKEFGFSATGGVVLHAYIKGGNGYNDYDYTPDGVTSDGGMFAPDTNGDGIPQGLSHAVFCTGEGDTEESNPPSDTPPSNPPSFEQSQAGVTECPCDTVPGTQPTSSPADGAWMLVVALGVLLASIVVLTPARAKRQR